ncbi:MAG: polynucleotide adenylyltransferase PcnB [Planctomycetota bacterium]|jgi:poly(A) polymerase
MQQEQSDPARIPPIDPAAIDPDAVKVLRRLNRHGHDAYLVGGCVRDLLLDLRPKDFDIATSARPNRIRRLFRNSRVIGRRFRLVHIQFGRRILEVSTFRAPPIADGEDPYITRDNVYGTEEQDAKRRDFTINGLFYDVESERVIDHVGGLDDLRAGVLRTIGDPDLRLREDPVRILRAAKFAGRLGFALTDDLRKAAIAHAQDLRKAAPPRVLEELYRLASGLGSADAFRILEELGALQVILPEISPPPVGFYRALGRLEEETQGNRDAIPQSLMLSVLFWPRVGPRLTAGTVRDIERELQALLQPLSERMTIARRDLTCARLCLAAQLRFAGEPHSRSAKRFCRREIFGEAMLLRKIVGPLPDTEDAGHLASWEELAERIRESIEQPQRRKRRRRRRRDRRRKALSNEAQAGKDEACPQPSESSSAPVPSPPPNPSPTGSSNDGSSPA